MINPGKPEVKFEIKKIHEAIGHCRENNLKATDLVLWSETFGKLDFDKIVRSQKKSRKVQQIEKRK